MHDRVMELPQSRLPFLPPFLFLASDTLQGLAVQESRVCRLGNAGKSDLNRGIGGLRATFKIVLHYMSLLRTTVARDQCWEG